jgi:hypothetical protein
VAVVEAERESGAHANNLADRCANPEWPAPRQWRMRRTSPPRDLAPIAGTSDGRIKFRVGIKMGDVVVR